MYDSTYNLITIDPGTSGGFVLRHTNSGGISPHPFVSFDQVVSVVELMDRDALTAVIETVHASPIMGTSSAFKFGENYGQWLGVLRALGVTTYGVRPQEWQYGLPIASDMKGPSRKTALRRLADSRHLGFGITLATCDAVLMSDWAVNQMSVGKSIGKLIS